MTETIIPERGVKNTKVVDLIYPASDGSQVILKMIEDRPWSSDPEQFSELEEKFNNYLDYILDGWFLQQYPAYKGKEICIELSCTSQPDAQAESIIAQMQSYSQSVGIKFLSVQLRS